MTGLARFWQRGAEDADRRVAAILAPPPLGNADRYLMSSALVRAADDVFTRVHASMLHSQSARAATALRQLWLRADWSEKYRAIGLAFIIAVGVHIGATLSTGQRPVWFRLIVPALVAAFAGVVLIASLTAVDESER